MALFLFTTFLSSINSDAPSKKPWLRSLAVPLTRRMGPSTSAVALILIPLFIAGVGGSFIKYNTSAGIVDGKINVHLVAHTHDDVGWLKTVDEYYDGSNNSIQGACVRNILDSVIVALLKDPNRKFVYVEQAFFQTWWAEQNEATQEVVKKLVESGQLEFINGGWCMHDEAATHYIDMIDQTTLGHLMIKKQFNKIPRVGWQIDAFGHSAVQSYLLGAELGFDSVFFARIDYQDRAKRKADKSLEAIWRGSRTFGPSSQIFAGAFPVHYGPPNGFHFEVNDYSLPVQDNPLFYDYNVDERVNDFIDAAVAQANVTQTNHIMWTMGDDFQYQYAESWFRQMDKLINYVNKDGRVHALYSTPSIYIDAKNAANEEWPLKTDDYFPYAEHTFSYYTGYYTSRPTFKRFVRALSGYYLAARQLEFLVGRKPSGPFTSTLGDALGIAQHHDAVSGTSLQHTTDDYAKRLSFGALQAEMVVNLAVPCLTNIGENCTLDTPLMKLSQCNLLNISYCPPTEEVLERKSLVMVVYNPLGWKRTEYVRIPVNDNQLVVRDSNGNLIETQFIQIENITIKMRNLYVKAYLGELPKIAPKFWLVFEVFVPPLGWNTYFISKTNKRAIVNWNERTPTILAPDNDTVEIGPGPFRMFFSSSSKQLKRMANYRTGVDVPVQQTFLWYGSSPGKGQDSQASTAYIFRPNGAPPTVVSRLVSMKVVKGPLVHEVHQQFGSWIYQVTRLFKDKESAEFEFTIGPIPTEDGIGKEVITRLTTNMVTNKTFYTDSNGRDFIKRIRDYRTDWNLTVTQPIAGNYYPLNLGIYLDDGKHELSVLVDRACGGSSIQDGQMEIMLHRRLLNTDGLGEALNETVCVDDTCQGLTVRGTYYLSINKLGNGAQWRRTSGQHIYSPVLLAFTHADEKSWKSSKLTKASWIDPNYSLPPNVALITLEELDDGIVLLRLAHLYEASEDVQLSVLAKVELKKIFAGKTIKELKETSLSANQDKSKMKKMNWRVERDDAVHGAPVRGGPVSNSTLIVELGPMEIRTFLLTF
ncbi:alpha-mannosidase [Apostasia shenzhenica]|uniref:Alpha-mannosidase n=1 Tax=Apostasia shenzhenica TaxID=1088818 RepID=A0A2I0AES9_9ASPA|nr:alpha-mannosidase [Apostasia shenzhenica]